MSEIANQSDNGTDDPAAVGGAPEPAAAPADAATPAAPTNTADAPADPSASAAEASGTAAVVSPQQRALRSVLMEIENGAASVGWDRPPSIYALVPTKELMGTPEIPGDVLADLERAWDGTDTHLSAILQESVVGEDVEELLPKLAWPESVWGAAVTVERIIVPPAVEEEAPEDPDEALAFISNHPARTDVRLSVAVTREGDSWCAIRARNFDDAGHVATGETLVPSMVEALKIGFLPDEDVAAN